MPSGWTNYNKRVYSQTANRCRPIQHDAQLRQRPAMAAKATARNASASGGELRSRRRPKQTDPTTAALTVHRSSARASPTLRPPPTEDIDTRWWEKALSDAERAEKNWRARGRDIVQIYRGDIPITRPKAASTTPPSSYSTKQDTASAFNILYANTEVMLPAAYSKPPDPVVRSRFVKKTADPIQPPPPPMMGLPPNAGPPGMGPPGMAPRWEGSGGPLPPGAGPPGAPGMPLGPRGPRRGRPGSSRTADTARPGGRCPERLPLSNLLGHHRPLPPAPGVGAPPNASRRGPAPRRRAARRWALRSRADPARSAGAERHRDRRCGDGKGAGDRRLRRELPRSGEVRGARHAAAGPRRLPRALEAGAQGRSRSTIP